MIVLVMLVWYALCSKVEFLFDAWLFHGLTGMFGTVAKALANVAHNHSKDSSFDSPYSQEARAQVR